MLLMIEWVWRVVKMKLSVVDWKKMWGWKAKRVNGVDLNFDTTPKLELEWDLIACVASSVTAKIVRHKFSVFYRCRV